MVAAVLLTIHIFWFPLGTGTFACVPLAMLVGALLGRHYRRDQLALTNTAVDDISQTLQLGLLGGMAAVAPIETIDGVGLVAGFSGLLFGAVLVGRANSRRLANALGRPERCLVIGDPERFGQFRRHLDTTAARIDIVDWVDIDRVGAPEHGNRTVERLIDEGEVDRVIVLADDPVDHTAQVARRSRNAGVTVTLCPRVVETFGPLVMPELVGGSVALTAPAANLRPGQRFLKRSMDVAGATMLLAFATPFMLVAAAAIKLTSPGPVLFWQTRVGRDGRRFRIAKFRTMVQGAEELKEQLRDRNEAVGLFKIAADPRVTPMGRLLRRTSLDELPQLLNVIKGDMSLVGPRPLVCDEDALVSGWHRDRLRLAPGMTGPWQVARSARVPLADMVLIDHHYVSNWSLWSDVGILLRTARFVIGRHGL
jgi:lipopolysaccharide/colanic/teichoic acid biosynthesis glycosyltransferase